MESLIKGADLSTLLEVEECGGKFYDDGREADAMEILKAHGVGLVRLRLWNDPYSADGRPYGAGTCDLPRVMKLAARAKALGLPWMLDFHYSDFWADPGKQFLPKAWRGMDEAGLAQAVHDYTRDTLLTLKNCGLLPAYVAVGNEITNGLLWPVGKRWIDAEETGQPDDHAKSGPRPNTAAMVRLLNSGIHAVREAAPDAKVILHLDQGGNNALYRDWFDAYLAQGGEDFDVIGLSYYPFWHGTMEDLRTNLTDLAKRYHKPMMIVETAMAFTYEEYQLKEEPDGMIWGSEGSAAGEVQTGQNGGDQKKHLAERAGQIEQKAADQQKPLAAGAELGKDLPWPGTPQGQIEFLRDLARVIREIPEELCKGFIWWEPAWIPVQGSGWATPAALEYLHDKGPGGNEWANQALFDYRGNALPALKQLEAL